MHVRAIKLWVDDENEHQLNWFMDLMEQEFHRRFKRIPEPERGAEQLVWKAHGDDT